MRITRFYVPYNSTTKCEPKDCHFFKVFCNKSSATNRHWHQIHTGVGKQAEQKQTDRMTHSRLCFPPEWDSPPPQAISQETYRYGREVKRQLNVLASLDKFSGTVVLRGVKYKRCLSPLAVEEKTRSVSVLELLVPFFFTLPELLLCHIKVLCKS